MAFITHISADGLAPPSDDAFCCWGAVMERGCTCWEPVFDASQQPLQPGQAEPRASMCVDCACRSDSPERREHRGEDGPSMRSSWEGVHRLAEEGRPFYCHQGMRRLVGYRHPSGAEMHVEDSHRYEPAVGDDDTHYKADGTPADLCAGWAALRTAGVP